MKKIALILTLLSALVAEAQTKKYSTDSLVTTVGTFVLVTSEPIESHAVNVETTTTEDGGQSIRMVSYPAAVNPVKTGRELSFVCSPNPASGILSVNASDVGTLATINIHNTLGQLVYSNTLLPDTDGKLRFYVDMQPYLSGVYFLSIRDNQSVRTQSIVRQ